ncbi:MAG: efflux RND transporter permease subunit [Candidatus Competibacterales bacterium]
MIDAFVRHPTAANLLMVFILALGAVSLSTLQRETFPDFTATEVQVSIAYPGASASEVEEAICLRLEEALDTVTAVDEIRCEAREGLATTVVEAVVGADPNRLLVDVKTEVDAIDDFPDLVETPVVSQLGLEDQVVSLAVAGPMAATDLKTYAEDLKARIQRLPAVSQVEIQGFSQRQLQVEVSEAALRRFNLSLEDVATAIERQSVDRPIGDVETSHRELLVRLAEERRTPAALANLVIIATPAGGQVRLGDIATIRDTFALPEAKVVFNGQRAALLAITKAKDEDVLTVFESVKEFVAAEGERVPPGTELVLTQDVASIVADRLALLTRNGFQGLLLVFGVMGIFFAWRYAFWVAFGLPVAFLGALFAMAVLDYSINMLSMVALLIALGLLMDDAIVIAENVGAKRSAGLTPRQAAIQGTRQVGPGVLSSFLTTAAVFGPLAFLAGDIGKVLSVVPVVLLLVLLVSFVEAFLILPHHLSHAMAHTNPPGGIRRAIEGGLDWTRERVVGRAADVCIQQRYLFIGATLATLVISLGWVAAGHLKFQAFPDLDGDVVQARLLLPQGTPLARTEAIVAEIVAGLEVVNAEFSSQPGGQSLVQQVSVRYSNNPDAFETGPHVATVIADLLTAEVRTTAVDDLINRWRDQVGTVPDAIALTFVEPNLGPAGRAIEMRLRGDDLDQLKGASLALQDHLASYRGVVDLSDDLRPGKPELQLKLKEENLGLGLDAAAIAGQLRAGFFGTTANEIQIGTEDYEVEVRLAAADRASIEALEEFRLVSGETQIPLQVLADVDEQRGYSRIQRIDGQRTVTVIGDVDTSLGNATEIVAATQGHFRDVIQPRFPGVALDLQGQSAEAATTGASLLRGFIIGLLGVFIILSFQFRSYLEPVVVMTAIPLVAIGVIWGHWLMGIALSMPSILGAASLAGIVVNDSILLVQFLKLNRRAGMATLEAARRASRERFRAILLTSLTTIAGLLPLLFERSLQAQVLIPLAVSIVFGLAITTVLVLLVVPALYCALDDWGLTEAMDQGEAPPPGREAVVEMGR